MFYAKIGASFVTKTGCSKYPMRLAKFETAAEALDHARFMRIFYPCKGVAKAVLVRA